MTRRDLTLTAFLLLSLAHPVLADEITTSKPGRAEGGLLAVPRPPERAKPAQVQPSGSSEGKPSGPSEGKPSGTMACGRKHFCREMTSCAEARFYLGRCGLARLDRDHDGIPCEPLCP